MALSEKHLSGSPTIEKIIQCASAQLVANSDTATLDVELLLSRALNKDRTYLFTWNDKVVRESELDDFNALLDRRIKGEPIAYILGEQEFWDLTLSTDEHTLIPRADTETLIEWVLELEESFPQKANVIDLGTGTGAIALALAKENPHWSIEAVDLMPKAVALAQKNAIANNLERVRVYQSRWFENVEGVFDLIVSNPPYIDPEDEHLAQGDVRFEPRTALIADNKGLADLDIIADQSRQYLVNGGWLFMEHGYDQLESVQAIFRNLGYQKIATRLDLGGNPRITAGQFFYE